MYCKHCGKEIADDSRFCHVCGGPQDVDSSFIKVKEEKSKEENGIYIPKVKINFSDSAKCWTVACALWLILNLYWLFADKGYSSADSNFLPFCRHLDDWCGYYDLTEFIVYVFGLPFIVWGIMLLKEKLDEKDDKPSSSTKEDGSNKHL